MTNNLFMRVMEHRAAKTGSYTARYRITRLVYVESYKYVNDAIAREKKLKDWRRDRKITLIEADNPAWEDLAEGWEAVEERMRRLALGLEVPLLQPVREPLAFGEADPSALLRDDSVAGVDGGGRFRADSAVKNPSETNVLGEQRQLSNSHRIALSVLGV
jgi:putative endonuclease